MYVVKWKPKEQKYTQKRYNIYFKNKKQKQTKLILYRNGGGEGATSDVGGGVTQVDIKSMAILM